MADDLVLELVRGARVRAAEAAAASDQLSRWQLAQLVTEMLGCRDDHAAQLDERDATGVDGAASPEQEHPQGLLPLPRARERHRVGGEPCASGSDRVQWFVL